MFFINHICSPWLYLLLHKTAESFIASVLAQSFQQTPLRFSMRSVKRDTLPTWRHGVLCTDSVNMEVSSKPVLWICPRYRGCGAAHGWSLIAARAWSHVPSCTGVKAVLVEDSPAIWGKKLVGACGGQRQGDPARWPSMVTPWSSRGPIKSLLPSSMGSLTHVLLYSSQHQGGWLRVSFCLEFMANNSCKVQLLGFFKSYRQGSTHSLTRLCWGLEVTSRLPATTAAQVWIAWEQAVAHELVGQDQCPDSSRTTGSSRTTVPGSSTSSSNACSHGSRFCAGCFPKH